MPKSVNRFSNNNNNEVKCSLVILFHLDDDDPLLYITCSNDLVLLFVEISSSI